MNDEDPLDRIINSVGGVSAGKFAICDHHRDMILAKIHEVGLGHLLERDDEIAEAQQIAALKEGHYSALSFESFSSMMNGVLASASHLYPNFIEYMVMAAVITGLLDICPLCALMRLHNADCTAGDCDFTDEIWLDRVAAHSCSEAESLNLMRS